MRKLRGKGGELRVSRMLGVIKADFQKEFGGWFEKPITHLGAKFRFNGGGILDVTAMWVDRDKKAWKMFKKKCGTIRKISILQLHTRY